MKLTSPVFEDYKPIPSKYTCEGLNFNPELHFEDVPKEAISLVLIIEDPDVPKFIRADCMWNHWVVFNIPAHTRIIKENSIPQGTIGSSTSGKIGYEGPCPPDKKHRYFFKLYALNAKLALEEGSSKDQVLEAMQNHVIDSAELIGTYEKHHVGES